MKTCENLLLHHTKCREVRCPPPAIGRKAEVTRTSSKLTRMTQEPTWRLWHSDIACSPFKHDLCFFRRLHGRAACTFSLQWSASRRPPSFFSPSSIGGVMYS